MDSLTHSLIIQAKDKKKKASEGGRKKEVKVFGFTHTLSLTRVKARWDFCSINAKILKEQGKGRS